MGANENQTIQAEPLYDPQGILVPDRIREIAIGSPKLFRHACNFLDQFNRTFRLLCKTPAGSYCHFSLADDVLQRRQETWLLQFGGVCEKCRGEKCPECRELGWSPRAHFHLRRPSMAQMDLINKLGGPSRPNMTKKEISIEISERLGEQAQKPRVRNSFVDQVNDSLNSDYHEPGLD